MRDKVRKFIPLDISNDGFNSNLCGWVPGSQSIIPHRAFSACSIIGEQYVEFFGVNLYQNIE